MQRRLDGDLKAEAAQCGCHAFAARVQGQHPCNPTAKACYPPQRGMGFTSPGCSTCFAVILEARRPCQGSAKAWHPKVNFATGSNTKERKPENGIQCET